MAPDPRQEPDVFYFGAVSQAHDGAVLAVRRVKANHPEPREAARAVRVDLDSGRVRDVVAFPRQGRDVLSVSGGPHAALYVTAAVTGEDVIISVRYAGEERGAPVEGLPAQVEAAVLQP